MFFILQIVGYAFLVTVIVGLASAAAVWYKRQTHVQLTPGELAEDRVKVAKADRDIAAIETEREFHQLIHDRILDARADKTPPGQVIGEITEIAGVDTPPLPSTSHQMVSHFNGLGFHVKSHLSRPKVYDTTHSAYQGRPVWRDK